MKVTAKNTMSYKGDGPLKASGGAEYTPSASVKRNANSMESHASMAGGNDLPKGTNYENTRGGAKVGNQSWYENKKPSSWKERSRAHRTNK